MTDHQLLQQYVDEKDQQAFAELVNRHVHWVNAMAERMVHDPALAADATQAVFILLSKKASTLRQSTIISGWLFMVTRFAAFKALRETRRRAEHERRAAIMREQLSESSKTSEESHWDQLRPMLDELVTHLRTDDRQAVVLRFYQQKSFPEIGSELKISEEAARKRVSRAIERLRAQFARRGVAVSAAVLGSTLCASLPHTASAAVVTAAAASGTSAAAVSVPGITKGAAAMLAWMTLKPAAAVFGCLLLAAGLTATVLQIAAPSGNATQARGPATAPATQSALVPKATNSLRYGRIINENDQPVAGARVTLIRFDPADRLQKSAGSAVTDADGRFQFPREQRVVNLLVQAMGYGISGGYFDEEGETWPDAPAEFEVNLPASVKLRFIGPDETAAAGVRVTLSYFRGKTSGSVPQELKVQFTQTTNAAGECVFPAMPRDGSLSLRIDDPRFASVSYRDEVRLDDKADVSAKPIKLQLAGKISGRLTFADTAKPAAGLRISADGSDETEGGGDEEVTDADGRFQLKQLRPGRYTVLLSDPPAEIRSRYAVAALLNLKVQPGQELTNQNLSLISGAIIRGKMTSLETGKPLEGVGVMIMGPQNPDDSNTFLGAKSGPDGEFLAHVPLGKQRVQFSLPTPVGMMRPDPLSFNFDLADGQTGTANFAVPASATPLVKGRVVDQDGIPVGGANILVERRREDGGVGGRVRGSSDADGNFTLASVEADSVLRARRGRASTLTPVNLALAGDFVTLTVQRDAVASVQIKVVNPEGKPIPGANVEVMEGGGMSGMVFGEKNADENGIVTFKRLFPDTKYRAWVNAPQFAHTEQQIPISPGRQTEVGPITLLRADSYISGMVVDDLGQPIEAANVVCIDEQRSTSSTARTDADGHFRFTNLVPGETMRIYLEQDRKRASDNQQVPVGTEGVLIVRAPPTTRPK